MRLTAETVYDADPDTVFEMFLNEDFQHQRVLDSGAEESEVEIRLKGDGTDGAVITMHRHLPADILPSQLRGRFGDRLTLIQVEDWGPAGSDGSRRASLLAEVSSAPVRVTGSLRLMPDSAGGSRQSLDAEIKAKIPLVGGWIENGAGPVIRSTFEAEGRIGQEWLAAQA